MALGIAAAAAGLGLFAFAEVEICVKKLIFFNDGFLITKMV